MNSKSIFGAYLLLLGLIVFAADRGALPGLLLFYRKIPFGDALGHFVLMGALSFLATRAFHPRRVALGRLRAPAGMVLTLAVVVLEEFSQIFIPGRTFSAGDLCADVLGIACFAWIAVRLAADEGSKKRKA